jgi:hypothetical protein
VGFGVGRQYQAITQTAASTIEVFRKPDAAVAWLTAG